MAGRLRLDFDISTEFFGKLLITNVASRVKSVQAKFSGVRTSPKLVDLGGRWNNTTDAINKINFTIDFGGTFNTGTTAILLGAT